MEVNFDILFPMEQVTAPLATGGALKSRKVGNWYLQNGKWPKSSLNNYTTKVMMGNNNINNI